MKEGIWTALLLLCLGVGCKQKTEVIIGGNYEVESIEIPRNLVAEVGGISFMPDGKLVACFHRGEVMIYDPVKAEWALFAKGLHDPLGILAVNNHEVLVMQRPELTRITDTDRDGLADKFQVVTDDFGMSGNYHEFGFGPELDELGNYFISLNTASNGAGIRDEIRGEFEPLGRPGRMYACVPYRGWVMRVSPNGEMIPWASGFRSPNGLALDKDGNLFVTDNQGDWLGTSKLYHVREGGFYGHPSSLVWEDSFDLDPLTIPVPVLNKMRTKASVLFPQGLLANSPTQPVFDYTNGKFGPFEGQMFIGEMNYNRILRVMLEEVGGEMQGACVGFLEGTKIRMGNNRMEFAPDGSLWIGQNDHGWAGDEGIQRVVFKGGIPMEVKNMNLTDKGFRLTFTKAVAKEPAVKLDNFAFKRYYYKYHRKYGSQRFDVNEVTVTSLNLLEDRLTLDIELAELIPGYVYEMTLANIKGADGEEVQHPVLYYTLNRLKRY